MAGANIYPVDTVVYYAYNTLKPDQEVGFMPILALVLMCIGAVGILVSIVAFLYGLVNWEEEWPFARVIIGSFII